MATYNSTIAEVQYVRAAESKMLLPTALHGRVRIASGSYTPAEAVAAGSVVRLVKLPKSARLLPQSQLHFEAGQGSATVKVGDEKSDARYLAAVAPGASAVSKNLDADKFGGYLFEEEMFVVLTTGAAALTEGKKIAFDIFYVID